MKKFILVLLILLFVPQVASAEFANRYMPDGSLRGVESTYSFYASENSQKFTMRFSNDIHQGVEFFFGLDKLLDERGLPIYQLYGNFAYKSNGKEVFLRWPDFTATAGFIPGNNYYPEQKRKAIEVLDNFKKAVLVAEKMSFDFYYYKDKNVIQKISVELPEEILIEWKQVLAWQK